VKRNIFFILLCIFIRLSVFAQLNEYDTIKTGYRFSSNGSWITGNVERLILNNQFDFIRNGKNFSFKSSNQYTYGTIFKRETENDFFVRNFLYHNYKNKIYPYAMLWFQSSKRQLLEQRWQAGLGYTYRVLQQKKWIIKTSATLSYETSTYENNQFNFIPEGVSEQTVTCWRGTGRIWGVYQHKKLKISNESWYQQATSDANNYRLLSQTQVDYAIHKRLSFRTQFQYMYENLVVSRVKKEDKMLTFGLAIGNF